MDWKETVTTVSEKVFPGLMFKIDEKLNIENEVMSNLPLQMSLYFNVIFAPIWICIMGVFLNDKYNCYNELYKFITVTILIAVLVVELLRLYLGYEGNLRDKIPELAGFWMLSILLQFPLQGLLLFNPYFNLEVMEIVIQSTMFTLLCVQLISGYSALKYTATKQATYFKIMRLKNDGSSQNQDKYKTS